MINDKIDSFTVMCLVSSPFNERDAGVDFFMIQTFLFFLC